MFDGSHYPIDENVKQTKSWLRSLLSTHALEAEVGSIGGEEDGVLYGECADPRSARVADLESTLHFWYRTFTKISG